MPAINLEALDMALKFADEILSMREGEIKDIQFSDELFRIKREVVK